jgi:CBS domain-containing protein
MSELPSDSSPPPADTDGSASRTSLASRSSETAAPTLLATPLRQLVTAEVLWAEPSSTVGEIAERMHRAGAGSILVRPGAESSGHGEGPGIVTDRDLRGRVLARGLGPETPAGEIASRPLHTLDADQPIFAAHLRMLEERIHHLAITDEEEIVGVVSSTDLLRHQSAGPFWVLHRLDRDPGLEWIGGYREQVTTTVETLHGGGMEASRLARVVSSLNDHLVHRLVERAMEELGPPPAPWAWLVFGSEGRHEQTLLTDQDNALVYDGDPSDEGEYFHRLAEHMTGRLIEAGFPPCPGGYMASRWCAPLPEWQKRFRRWVEEPEPEALLGASIFFDFRQAAGDLDLEPLHAILDQARENSLFLHHLFALGRDFRIPLGLLGRFKTDRSGLLDLKAGGLVPIVCIARVAALAAGSRARSTLERLDEAAGESLSREGADTLADAFAFFLELRLTNQLEHHRLPSGAALSSPNQLRPKALKPGRVRQLREHLLRVRRIREALRQKWG